MRSKEAASVKIHKCFKNGKWQKELCAYVYSDVTLVKRKHAYGMDLMFAKAEKRVCVGFLVLGRFGK